jgi:hypothetical protein
MRPPVGRWRRGGLSEERAPEHMEGGSSASQSVHVSLFQLASVTPASNLVITFRPGRPDVMRHPGFLLLGAALACGDTSANPTVPSEAAAPSDAAMDRLSPTMDGLTDSVPGVDGIDDTTENADAPGADGTAAINDRTVPSDADAAGAASAADGDAVADALGGCPDVRGQFSIQTSGSGCGSIPCIRAGMAACDIVFQSMPAGGGDSGPSAINGAAQLQADGSFAGASLTVGTIPRMGCRGTWDPATSTMTVDCGAVDASQGCVLRLKRYASTCN